MDRTEHEQTDLQQMSFGLQWAEYDFMELLCARPINTSAKNKLSDKLKY